MPPDQRVIGTLARVADPPTIGPMAPGEGVIVMEMHPSASYSLTIRTEVVSRPGMLGRVTSAIGQEGGLIGAIDIVSAGDGRTVRDVTVAAGDEGHGRAIVE